MRRVLWIAAAWALGLILLTMVACGVQPATSSAPVIFVPLETPVGANDQATLSVALTQVQDANYQAAATAEIERANAQATLDSANATLSAAQIQQQNSADIIAAQIAAAAQIVRANAQATLVAASSTQSAALTQDAYRQTQVQYAQQGTAAAASTQTAVANFIATQTQSAIATSQWYADQARQRAAQRQGPITFLWVWCLPVLIILFAILGLWGFWRWLRIKQDNQRIVELPAEKTQLPVDPNNLQDNFLAPGRDVVNGRIRLTQPDDQMRGWLDEIKRKLLDHEKDNDGNPDD